MQKMGIFYNYDLITYLNTGLPEDIEELKTESNTYVPTYK